MKPVLDWRGKMAPARRGLVGPRSDWTPEEVARYEVALCSGLSRDKKAQRVYLAKLRVVESARAKGVAAMSLSGGTAPEPVSYTHLTLPTKA